METRSGLRVAILGINYAPEPTGIAPYTTGLAEGLSARGHDVDVLTSFPHYPQWVLADGLPRRSRYELNGVTVHRHRHYVPRQPRALNRVAFELSFAGQALTRRRMGVDVVLGISPALLACSAAFARAKTFRDRPALGLVIQDIYSQGIAETGAGGGLTATLMQRIESATARAADGVAVIHGRFAERVEHMLGVDREHLRVIRNWTHLPQGASFDHDSFRRSMGWGSGEVVVLHAGAMGAKQGLENVVEAARLADLQHANVRFVLLGDGNQRRALEEMSRGVKRIDIVDPLDGVAFQRALRAADVLLVNERPGVVEMAVPSKLTSYFNAGKPVLAATESQSTTASELAAAGAGVRVDPGKPQSLLAAALGLAADRARAEQLGSSGVRYARVVLSEEAAIDAYDAWVWELAELRGKVAGKLA